MREHTGTSFAIAVVAVAFLVALPFLLPTALWFVLTAYAIVKAAGSAPDDAGALAVLLAVVATVTVFTLLIALAIYVLGRPMTPKKRRDMPRAEIVADEG